MIVSGRDQGTFVQLWFENRDVILTMAVKCRQSMLFATIVAQSSSLAHYHVILVCADLVTLTVY